MSLGRVEAPRRPVDLSFTAEGLNPNIPNPPPPPPPPPDDICAWTRCLGLSSGLGDTDARSYFLVPPIGGGGGGGGGASEKNHNVQ